jgi:hypothetical protein
LNPILLLSRNSWHIITWLCPARCEHEHASLAGWEPPGLHE